MEQLYLEEAVSHIVQTVNSHDKSNFFFIVGAGVSAPVIPLAEEIQAHCRQIAIEAGRLVEPTDSDPMSRYAHWFKQAYHQARDRNEYLAGLVENKPISPGNLRLAHVLLGRRLANLVVTPNFDDSLPKALRLFGANPILCDHPQTVERIDPERDEIQIVYVHGTYRFYDGVNLKQEIKQRARRADDTVHTMASLLDAILTHRVPIVMGYSGWEKDIIMQAIRRRLSPVSTLDCNLYWFCHTRQDAKRLPAWLTAHHCVCLVVPRETASISANAGSVSGQVESVDALDRSEALPDLTAAGMSPEPSVEVDKLSAETVLGEIIRQLKIPAPLLTTDPVSFLSQQIEEQIPLDDASRDGDDIYFLANLVHRLNLAKVADQRYVDAQKRVEKIRNLVRQSEYREAISVGAEVAKENLEYDQLDEMANAVWAAATRLSDQSDDELKAYDLVVAFVAAASEVAQVGGEARLTLLRKASLMRKMFVLFLRENYQEAMECADQVVPVLRDLDAEQVRQDLAQVLVTKGVCLNCLGRSEEAEVVLREVITQFGESTGDEVQSVVRTAYRILLVNLHTQRRQQDLADIADDVVNRYQELHAPDAQWLVSMALNAKAFALLELGQREGSLEAFGRTIERYRDSTDPTVQGQVAWAFCTQGIVLEALKRTKEAGQRYQELLRLLSGGTDEIEERLRYARNRLKAVRNQLRRAKGVRVKPSPRNESP